MRTQTFTKSTAILVLLACTSSVLAASSVCNTSYSNLCSTQECSAALQTQVKCVTDSCYGLTDQTTKYAECISVTCKSSDSQVAGFYDTYAKCLKDNFSATTTYNYSSTIKVASILFLALSFLI